LTIPQHLPNLTNRRGYDRHSAEEVLTQLQRRVMEIRCGRGHDGRIHGAHVSRYLVMRYLASQYGLRPNPMPFDLRLHHGPLCPLPYQKQPCLWDDGRQCAKSHQQLA